MSTYLFVFRINFFRDSGVKMPSTSSLNVKIHKLYLVSIVFTIDEANYELKMILFFRIFSRIRQTRTRCRTTTWSWSVNLREAMAAHRRCQHPAGNQCAVAHLRMTCSTSISMRNVSWGILMKILMMATRVMRINRKSGMYAWIVSDAAIRWTMHCRCAVTIELNSIADYTRILIIICSPANAATTIFRSPNGQKLSKRVYHSRSPWLTLIVRHHFSSMNHPSHKFKWSTRNWIHSCRASRISWSCPSINYLMQRISNSSWAICDLNWLYSYTNFS